MLASVQCDNPPYALAEPNSFYDMEELLQRHILQQSSLDENNLKAILSAIECVQTTSLPSAVDKLRLFLLAPSTPLEDASFILVIKAILGENILEPGSGIRDLMFSAPFTSPATQQPTTQQPSNPAAQQPSSPATQQLNEFQMIHKRRMWRVGDREACGTPLLGFFLLCLADRLTKALPYSFYTEMEFPVIVGTKPACDGAVVAAAVSKPVLLYEYKPVVDTRTNLVSHHHLMEVLLQAYYCLYQHKVPTYIHCLTDLSQWYYFQVEAISNSRLKILWYHSIKDDNKISLDLHFSFLCPLIKNYCLPKV